MTDSTQAKPGGEGGQSQPDAATLLSRTGSTGPYGALTHELGTKVDEELGAAFRMKCAEAGTTHAEVLRNWINEFMRDVSYDDAVIQAAERRALHLSRQGLNRGPSSALTIRGEVSAR